MNLFALKPTACSEIVAVEVILSPNVRAALAVSTFGVFHPLTEQYFPGYEFLLVLILYIFQSSHYSEANSVLYPYFLLYSTVENNEYIHYNGSIASVVHFVLYCTAKLKLS